mgnify:CR=1 FL=1
MNTETNMFEGLPQHYSPQEPSKYIPFEIGEYFELKGYKFRVCEINVSKNRIVLLPVGLAQHVRNAEAVRNEMDEVEVPKEGK